MNALSSLAARPLRSALTISGVVIGVLALTVLGALAERSDLLFEGGARYVADHVTVASRNAGARGGLLTASELDKVSKVAGVGAAFPTISLPARVDADTSGRIMQSFIRGNKPGYEDALSFKLRISRGHALDVLARGEVVLGSDLARELGADVGDQLELPVPAAAGASGGSAGATGGGRSFTVVGVLDKTLTLPDAAAFVGYDDAAALLLESLSPALRRGLAGEMLMTEIDVFATPGADLDALADRIAAQVESVRARRPSEVVASFRSTSQIFAAITMGSALIALIVGGLAIINTMSMAVLERVREIGLKKALGATTGQIAREFLAEAGAIGLVGGVVGVGLGSALALGLNSAASGSESELFVITPRLLVGALTFALTIAVVAGVLPAIRAARLDPVTALRMG